MNPLGPTQSLSGAARRMRRQRERRRRALLRITVQLRRIEVVRSLHSGFWKPRIGRIVAPCRQRSIETSTR
jgi:hypothetical protein